MRVLIIALLAAISYAQTVLPNNVQDGQTLYAGICSILEDNQGTCSALANQCVTAYCREQDNACFIQGKEYGVPCTTEAQDETGEVRTIRGVCVDSECVWSADAGECPDPILSADRTFISCGNAGFSKTWRFQSGEHCMQTGSSCQDVAAQMSNLECQTSQTKDDPEHEIFQIVYLDTRGTDDTTDDECIIGERSDCIIQAPGSYEYKGMLIDWSGAVETANEITTQFTIPYTSKNLTPKVLCPFSGTGYCRGTVTCEMIGPEPCGRVVETCDGTYPPTTNPTLMPSMEPTVEPTANPTLQPATTTSTTSPEPLIETTTTGSSHGDPVIWTFHGECYDLDADGLYLASSHAWFDHDVYISIHNDYMREIQVVNKTAGNIMLAINNLGEILNNDFPYHLEKKTRKCEEHQEQHCDFSFTEFIFDAQDFEYRVQILPHDYLDPALKEGESGVHLDIYPRPFEWFNKDEYNGLYFHNPLPHILGACPAE